MNELGIKEYADVAVAGGGCSFYAELVNDLAAYQRVAIFHVIAKTNLVQLIRNGVDTVARLADSLGFDPRSLARFMSVAERLDLFRFMPDGSCEVTERGALIDPSHPHSVHAYALLSVDQYWPAWRLMIEALKTGETTFDSVFACTPWEYRRRHPEQGRAFDAWQRGESTKVLAQIMDVLDLGPDRRVVDVGGGNGTLLEACLQKWPHLEAMLFEQPHTLAAMESPQAGVPAAGVRRVPGDFFQAIDLDADCFILKSILHDWDDVQAASILTCCARAMSPGSRLIVIERVLREGLSLNAHMVDLRMLLVTGGRERTLDEYQQLLTVAGLAMTHVLPTQGDFSLLECRLLGEPS